MQSEPALRRLLVAILMLALAVLPAGAGVAGPAGHALDCHDRLTLAAGHGHQHGSPAVPAAGEAACCLLHCAAAAAVVVATRLPAPRPASAFQAVDERSVGVDVEPTIPPPRA